jgi:UDP-N-acetylglucosamine transferase subunit ALG13
MSVRGSNRLIFVTLGTHEQPLLRAIELVATLDGEDEIMIQHGSTPARPDLVTAHWVDYLESDALLGHIHRADVVISHAGVGSMITAIRNGKKPVVVPRLARFGEHVDDHQLELAEQFAARDLVFLCGPEDRIGEFVSRAKSAETAARPRENGLLREAVAEAALGGTRTRRSSALRARQSSVRSKVRSGR